jgi:competence protein ComEA
MTREERNVVLFVALGLLLGSLTIGGEEELPVVGAAGEPVEGPAVARPLYPIDVNRADVGLLEELPGIGPARAAAIAASRESGGPFRSVEDLRRVPGIGPGTIAKIRDLVVTGDSIAPFSRVGEESLVDGSPRDASPRKRGRGTGAARAGPQAAEVDGRHPRRQPRQDGADVGR